MDLVVAQLSKLLISREIARNLDDKEVANVEDNTQDGVGRIGLATWSTVARYDDVIVYGPDGPSQSVDPKGKTATTWGHIKSKLK